MWLAYRTGTNFGRLYSSTACKRLQKDYTYFYSNQSNTVYQYKCTRLYTRYKSPPVRTFNTVIEQTMTTQPIECSTTLPNGSIIASKQWNTQNQQSTNNTTYAVCVHGWLDNANSFDPLLNIVAPKLPHIQFICIDLPGHGKSSHTSRYDILSDSAALYNYVDVLLQKQPTATVHLIAHSWGGTCAQICASLQPDRIASIVLLDSLGPFTNEPHEIPALYATAVINRAKRASKPKKQYNSVDDIVAHYMSGNKYISKPSTEILMKRGATKLDNGKYVFAHDAQLQQWYMSLIEDTYLAFLKRLTCHVTHILAQNETRLRFIMKQEARDKFMKNFQVRINTYKSIELIRLANAEHHAHMCKAADVAPHVINHFNNLSDRSNDKQLISML